MAKPLPFQDPRRAFLGLFAVVSVAYFAIFVFSSWSLQQQLLSRASSSNDITARSVLSALQIHLATEPAATHQQSPEARARLDALIKQTTYGLGIRRVRIFSLEGDLIYSSDNEHPDESKVDDIDEVIESLRGSSSMLVKSESGAEVLEYFAPLRDASDAVYAVCELYFDISTVVSSSATAAKRTLLAGVAAFLIVALALCSYFLSLIRRFEAERRRQEESAERAKELKELARTGMFISGLAHQLRNPLSILKGVGGALSRREMSETQRPFVTALKEEVNRMEQLIESFLRFAQPRVEGSTASSAVVHQQVEQAVQIIEQLHPHLRVVRSIDPDLAVAINSDLLRESLINIFGNSVEALENRADPLIEIRTSGSKTQVEISIVDNGPGFSAEITSEPQLALRPFYTTKSSGSGLGLALVRKIVEEASGTVEISNAPEGGAMVKLTLPRIEIG